MGTLHQGPWQHKDFPGTARQEYPLKWEEPFDGREERAFYGVPEALDNVPVLWVQFFRGIQSWGSDADFFEQHIETDYLKPVETLPINLKKSTASELLAHMESWPIRLREGNVDRINLSYLPPLDYKGHIILNRENHPCSCPELYLRKDNCNAELDKLKEFLQKHGFMRPEPTDTPPPPETHTT
jgi:hypothetical protein